MNWNSTLGSLLFLLTPIAFGQTVGEKLIHGKIVVDSNGAEGVNIVNLVNEKGTITDKNGAFFILAKADDVLVFSAVNLEYKRKLIEEDDLKSDVVIINMVSKITELNEVIINEHPEINAESLGVIPHGQKTYTPAERKLQTAGDFKPIHLLAILGGSMPVDPIINKITGRTEMLKNEVEIEKKEIVLKLLEDTYDSGFLVDKLKINVNYIKGFYYYLVEDEKFRTALKSKNKTMATFLMGELAVRYNEMIACEEE